MCGEVLGKPLHHSPSKGGKEEGAKFDDWYEQTLRSYNKIFGETPPPDIWPAPKDRFKTREHSRRVDTTSNWVIPKRPAKFLAGLLLLGALLAGCSPGEAMFGVVLLVGGGIVVTAAIGALSTMGQGSGKRTKGSSGTGCGGGGCGTSSSSSDSSGDGGGSDGGSGCGGGCGGD
jgi:hypothetical protein